MRGVVSAGMVAALEQLNLKEAFDAVFGASAGAVAGAYFIAGQARYGTTIFYEDINNRQFISLARLLTGAPVMSLSFLLDHVCIERKPLAVDRVLQSDIAFFAIASSLTREQSVSLGGFSDARDLFEALRCSARIPFFAGPPVNNRGDLFVDASVYEFIPFRAARAEGFTDLVVLLTRPHGAGRSAPGLVDRLLVAPHLRRYSAHAAATHMSRDRAYANDLAHLYAHMGGASQPRVLMVQMSADVPELPPFDISRQALVVAAKAGFRAVYAALELEIPDVVEILTPVGLAPPIEAF